MANATCAACNGVYDTRSMRACPNCMEYLCVQCGDEHMGHCPQCDVDDE